MNPQWLKIASTSQTVLITGRTGTGKSHLARQLHDLMTTCQQFAEHGGADETRGANQSDFHS